VKPSDRFLPVNWQEGEAVISAQPDNAKDLIEGFKKAVGTVNFVYAEKAPDGKPNYFSISVPNRKLIVDSNIGKVTFASIFPTGESKIIESLFALNNSMHILIAVWDDDKKTMTLFIDGRGVTK
jgi:hypothetical protein